MQKGEGSPPPSSALAKLRTKLKRTNPTRLTYNISIQNSIIKKILSIDELIHHIFN